MSQDEIQYPSGFGSNDVVAWGTTGLVVLDKSSNTIIKIPFDSSDRQAYLLILREQQIYERLQDRGPHNGILSYHGTFESGIRVEYAPNHDLRSYIQKHDVTFGQRLHWAIQIIEAIDFIHGAGVIHGDLTSANIFLDKDLNAKLADFAGSSLDNTPLLVAITASHEYPGALLTHQGDIFAFGSVVYTLMTGNNPYRELPDDEIRTLFLESNFPDTKSLKNIGSVIRKCWQGDYTECKTIIKDLRAVQQPRPTSILLTSIMVSTLIISTFATTILFKTKLLESIQKLFQQ